jgi:hypothetical protein
MTNQYEQKAFDILSKAKTLMNQSDWTTVSNENNVLLQKKDFPEVCSTSCFRVSTHIKKPMNGLVDNIRLSTEETEKQDDPDVLEWSVIETGSNYRVIRQVNKMQWPIWNREVLYVENYLREAEDTISIVAYSIDHNLVPVQSNQYVRPILHMSVYRFLECTDGKTTHVTKITHMDPGGYIPASVVNMYADRMANTINKWKAN